MLLVLVALALTGPALQPSLISNPCPTPNEPSAAITTESANQQSTLAELQALRIRLFQTTTPPDVPAVETLPAPPAPKAMNLVMVPKAAIRHPSRKLWIGLAAGEHAAAVFDAWSTRRSLETGHAQELDPLVKPFSHSAVLYPALQVLPIASDFFSRKMMHSSHPLLRKTWWLPQSLGMTASILSGIHNLQFTH